VAILGSLLDALLPSEDGRLRGGGDFGDASASDADGRTVHSVKRRWPRPLDRAPLRRLSEEEGGGRAGAPSLLENGSRSGEDDGDDAFFYPILQRRRPGAASAARGSSSKGALVPWAQAPGAVRLRVLAESGLDAMVDQVCSTRKHKILNTTVATLIVIIFLKKVIIRLLLRDTFVLLSF
jgi:hypothetical protein